MFERAFSITYWIAAAVLALWLGWTCFVNMPWLMAVFVFPLVFVAGAAALARVLVGGAAIAAGAIAAVSGLIRLARRWRAV